MKIVMSEKVFNQMEKEERIAILREQQYRKQLAKAITELGQLAHKSCYNSSWEFAKTILVEKLESLEHIVIKRENEGGEENE